MPAQIPGLTRPPRGFSIGQQMKTQASQLLKRGVGGSGQAFDKVRTRHIWSTYNFSTTTGGAISSAGVLAQGEYQVFTTPIGQNGQGYPSGLGLSQRDTNLPGANRVSDQQNFAIWELGVGVIPMRPDVVAADTTRMSVGDPTPDDVDLICNNVVVSITYLTNRVPLGTVGMYAPASGPMMVAPTLLDFGGNQNVAGNGGGLGEGTNASPWDGRQARVARTGGQIAPAPALRRKLKVPIFLQSGDTFSFTFSVPRPVQLRTVAEGGTGGFALRLDWWAVESYREQG